HTLDIFRRGLQTNQDNSFTFLMSSFCFISGEVYFTSRSSRRCRQSGTDYFACFQSSRIEGRMQQLIQGFRIDTAYSLFRCDHSLVYQVTSDLDSSRSSSLSVTCLQEEQFAFLDGEFHILHIAVMVFQFHGKAHKLIVALRQILSQLADWLRSADTGYNILALCIDQVLTKDTFCTGRRVTGKCNTCSGGITHV